MPDASADDDGRPDRRPGRPRDTDIHRRLLDATLRVYADRGWSGFSLEAVAREAGVGKPTLYRRWSSREEVLMEAVSSTAVDFFAIDTGDLHSDLATIASQMFDYWDSPAGMAWAQVQIDRSLPDAVRHKVYEVSNPAALAAVDIFERAVDRQQIPADTNPALMLQTLMGATYFTAHTPPDSPVHQEPSARLAEQLARLLGPR